MVSGGNVVGTSWRCPPVGSPFPLSKTLFLSACRQRVVKAVLPRQPILQYSPWSPSTGQPQRMIGCPLIRKQGGTATRAQAAIGDIQKFVKQNIFPAKNFRNVEEKVQLSESYGKFPPTGVVGGEMSGNGSSLSGVVMSGIQRIFCLPTSFCSFVMESYKNGDLRKDLLCGIWSM